MKTTKRTYVMTKSYDQWHKALDYLLNAGEAFYLLYGNIENALSEHDSKQLDKRLPILVQWELDEYERDAVNEEWNYIKNIK